MKYHGGWSFTEAYNLPITIRRWFLQRLADQLTKEKEQMENSSSSSSKSYTLGDNVPVGPRRE
tara:strand:+ start:218 stop:406 length:189 start_codon:yes stop_codon:yes gene_type:complete